MIRVTAAILIKNERILIARRKDTDELAGKWEFPGGKIEENEAPEACLIREMKEEFGIEVSVKGFFGENIHHYEKESIRLLAYHTVWVGGNFSLNAHAAIKWVSLFELNQFDFAPADQPLVEKLQKNPL
jgi:8-oxo-dGTP diphosphatase